MRPELEFSGRFIEEQIVAGLGESYPLQEGCLISVAYNNARSPLELSLSLPLSFSRGPRIGSEARWARPTFFPVARNILHTI